MPRAKKPTPGARLITDPTPFQAIQIQPCATHPAGPYVCFCRLRTDEAVRALAQAMLEEMLARVGRVPLAVPPATAPDPGPSRPPPPAPVSAPPAPASGRTLDDDPSVDDPPLSQEAHEGMVKAALERRAQRDTVSVLRRPNVTVEG